MPRLDNNPTPLDLTSKFEEKYGKDSSTNVKNGTSLFFRIDLGKLIDNVQIKNQLPIIGKS